MVLSICGGTSIDMVARSRWSRSRSAKKESASPGPVTCRSCRTFFTQCARCHCADSQSAADTSAQPGNRRQSGSASSCRWYAYGCETMKPTLRFLHNTEEPAVQNEVDRKIYRTDRREGRAL